MKILGAHIDSPRIDIKQIPLYEETEMAFLDTHYYGGIKKYQWVAIVDTVRECEKAYVSLLATNGISDVKNESLFESVTGTIAAIAPVTIEGNTHYYVALENSGDLFDIDLSDKSLIGIIRSKDSIHYIMIKHKMKEF